MFDEIAKLLTALNSMTPLGVIGLLGTIIFLMVHRNGPIQKIKNNHLEHVQASLDKIAEHAERHTIYSEKQVDLLMDIKSDISYVKGKID